ncbi:hypothetical protein L1887_19690 [Cichorium endivia]|nr:hypothetical protein L1887_19690 [Cichorium endivia]
MVKSTKPPSAEELLRKIQDLEKRQSHLKQKISKLNLSSNLKKPEHQWSNSKYPHQAIGGPGGAPELQTIEPVAMKLTETQYFNIIQSTSQAIHIFGRDLRIIFWNRAAENLYGFTPAEACGKIVTELVVEPKDASIANYLLERTVNGETWAGEFPITNKRGEKFVVIATNTPYRDETGGLLGGMCISSDSRPYHARKPAKLGFNFQQPLQMSLASKISNLVKLKMKIGDNHMDREGGDDASTPSQHILYPFGAFSSMATEEHFTRNLTIVSGDVCENKPGIRKILSSKADAWMGKKGSVCSWKGNEYEVESFDPIFGRWGLQRLDINQEHEPGLQMSSCASSKLNRQLWENTNSTNNKIETSGLWFSSLNASSTSRSSSGSSTKSNTIIKVGMVTDSLDYEILWEDLITREQIGQGSTIHRDKALLILPISCAQYPCSSSIIAAVCQTPQYPAPTPTPPALAVTLQLS